MLLLNNRLMKVLYIYDYWTGGGAPASFREMVVSLKHHGVQPVVCICKKEDSLFFDSVGIPTIVTGHLPALFPNLYKGKRAPFRILKYFVRFHLTERKALKVIHEKIDMSQIDLIHTNSERNDIGCLISREYGVPHIMHIREFADLDYNCNPIRLGYISLFNKSTTKYICISEAVKKHWVRKGLLENKMEVVYNGVRNEDISISSDSQKHSKILRLVILGLVQKTKGQYLAIDAVSRLPREIRENVTLDIYGICYPDYKVYLMEMIERLGVKQQINFFEPRKDVHQILGQYQIGLMCSYAEGFGRVTAEYMHAQLGVIASDTGANPEIVDDGVNGLLFKYGDAQSLADCILKFYNDRDMLTNLSQAAREKALVNFTQRRNAQAVHHVYEKLIHSLGGDKFK